MFQSALKLWELRAVCSPRNHLGYLCKSHFISAVHVIAYFVILSTI